MDEPQPAGREPVAARVDDATPRHPTDVRRFRPKPFRDWSETARGLTGAVAVFLLSRVVTIMVAHILVLITSMPDVTGPLSVWDGAFYIRIAEAGYEAGAPADALTDAMAFFPAYPLLIRGMSTVSGASPALAGIALTTVAGAGAMATIWALTRRLTDGPTASRTVVLLSFFPSAYVLSMVYPEGLFLLVASGTLLALLLRRWVTAGILAAVATAVRPNGVVLVLCCLWAAVVEVRRSGSLRALVAPLVAPVGGVAYAAYLWVVAGTPLAFLQVQEQTWGMGFDFGVSNARAILELVRDPQLHRFVALLFALGAAMALFLLVRWRPPGVITIYAVGLIALAVLSTNTTSIVRFVMSAFPLLIPFAARIGRTAFGAVAATSAALMVSSFVLAGLLYVNP